MTILYLDTETYSEVPIKNGTHAYAEGVEIMVFAYAWGDDPVTVVDLVNDPNGKQHMTDVLDVVGMFADRGDIIVAHNSHFDRTILRHCGYDLPVDMWHDTMVRALCHGLPGSLDKLSDIFRLGDAAKDKRGKALIQLFCKPRPKNMKVRRASRDTHPVEWQEFLDYAASDIGSMRVLYKRLPDWNYHSTELALWHLDQKINDRGILVDVELAEGAIEAVRIAQKRLAKKTYDITFGHVKDALKRDKLLKYILEYYEVDLPNMKADTLEKLLDADIPDELKELLRVRLQSSTTSTTKYRRVLSGVSSDGRLRGLIQFCGAPRTGRDAGRLFQPQNLMRPTLPQLTIDEGIAAMKAGCADLMYDNVMEIAANAMRGVLIAPPGKKLVVADLSNIEGVSAAWLAGETWKLDAFRAFFAGQGEDLYKIAYGRMFNVDPATVGKGQNRQIGKVAELMLQYEGGVGAYLTGAATYGIDLDAMAAGAVELLPSDIAKEAEKAYQWAKRKDRTFGLPRDTYVVCDAFKRMWRDAHPEITAMWKDLDEAMRAAIETPGTTFKVRSLNVVREKAWLRMVLPSGRSLCYPSPRIEKGKISYMGLSTFSRQWKRIYTYGGKAFENVTQAFARDVFKGTDMRFGADHLTSTAHRLEAAGYDLLLPVHDENVTEADDTDDYSVAEVCEIMATPPEWAPDLPLAAAGFETYHYRKGE